MNGRCVEEDPRGCAQSYPDALFQTQRELRAREVHRGGGALHLPVGMRFQVQQPEEQERVMAKVIFQRWPRPAGAAG